MNADKQDYDDFSIEHLKEFANMLAKGTDRDYFINKDIKYSHKDFEIPNNDNLWRTINKEDLDE